MTSRGLLHLALPGKSRAGFFREVEALRRLPSSCESAAGMVDSEVFLDIVAGWCEEMAWHCFSFRPPLDLRGTPFQRRVWQTLRKLPPGQTETYGELAERAGFPRSARAVGTAMRKNPIPLLVPCHRVVASGGLGGYGGNPELKRQLLALENAPLARTNDRGTFVRG